MKRQHATVSFIRLASVCALLFSSLGAASVVAAQTFDCGIIAGIETLLVAPRTVLFGEIHGTAESPAFLAEVACHAIAAGHSVTIALELPQRDQKLFDDYLASSVGSASRENLYSAFWRKTYQDGRTSVAMVELMERLHSWANSGGVQVVLIDRPEARQHRDEVMAAKLAEAIAANPEGLVLALTGNMHSRTAPGAPWNRDYKPLGYLLQESLPDLDLIALDVAHTGGTAWVCLSGETCQEQELVGKGTRESFTLMLFDRPDRKGFHGRYEVGAIRASPPAASSQ